MSIFTNPKLLGFIGWLFVSSLSAQTNTGQNEAAYKQSVSDAAAWRSNNPQVRIFSAQEYAQLPLKVQFENEGYGHLIVYRGQALTMAEVQAYQANAATIVSRTYEEYKNYLYTTNRAVFDQRSGITTPPAVPSNTIAPNPVLAAPVYTPNQLTRAEYNSLPLTKRAYIDAHPSEYIIIN
jgi:hypothetical protein